MKNLIRLLKNYDSIFIILIFLIITKFTCLIKLITGFPCPACGITRAYISLLHLKFVDAWNYNPLFWFIPYVVIFITMQHKPLFNNKKNESLFFIIVFSIIFSVYFYRMVTLFPNTVPMDYNKNSLLYNIYLKIYNLINLK